MATAWRRLGTPVVANGLAIPYATLVASYPAASYSGYEAYCSDLGANGARLRSNGTRWRPVDGSAMLASLGTPVSGITNSETIILQTLIPAGAWQVNDTLRIWATQTKTGTVDIGSLSVRIGTAGTTADTAITSLGPVAALSAAAVAGGVFYDVKLISATSAQRLGNNIASGQTYGAGGSVAAAAATTISSASANALYVTVTSASGGATNTVGAQSAQIQLITP